jgi:hypothetical protein
MVLLRIEWFHGNCVGVEPNTVKEHFFCPSCQKKKKKGFWK